MVFFFRSLARLESNGSRDTKGFFARPFTYPKRRFENILLFLSINSWNVPKPREFDLTQATSIHYSNEYPFPVLKQIIALVNKVFELDKKGPWYKIDDLRFEYEQLVKTTAKEILTRRGWTRFPSHYHEIPL